MSKPLRECIPLDLWSPSTSPVPRTFRCLRCASLLSQQFSRTGPTLCDACKDRERANFLKERSRYALNSIPERFAWTTEEHGRQTELGNRVMLREPTAAEKARKVYKDNKPIWLVIEGPPKTGKTSYACCLLARYIESGNHPTARFVTALALARAARTHPLGEGEAPMIREALAASVLVLDHVGDIIQGDNPVAFLILRRHERSLPTITTTHIPKQELAKRYGASAADAIYQGEVIFFARPQNEP